MTSAPAPDDEPKPAKARWRQAWPVANEGGVGERLGEWKVHAVGPIGVTNPRATSAGTATGEILFAPPEVADGPIGDAEGLAKWEPDLARVRDYYHWSCSPATLDLLRRALPILADQAHHPEVAALCEDVKRAIEAHQ